MVSKNMFTQIMELKRMGESRRYISMKLGVDKKTVSKYYAMSDEEYRSMHAASLYRVKIFDEYEERIPVSAIYDYLEEKCGHLPGTVKTLRNYVHYLEETGALVFSAPQRQYQQVPELPPGRQMQLDFGQYRTMGGTTLYICAAILSFSRYKYAIVQDRPFTTIHVISHLLNCFDRLGGMPEELVIDQDHLLVVSENSGDIIYTMDFGYFIDEMGYTPIERKEANLFFNLISELYVHTSIIITSNKSFDAWAETMGDDIMTTALLDRLLHHARVFTLNGDSYRINAGNNHDKGGEKPS